MTVQLSNDGCKHKVQGWVQVWCPVVTQEGKRWITAPEPFLCQGAEGERCRGSLYSSFTLLLYLTESGSWPVGRRTFLTQGLKVDLKKIQNGKRSKDALIHQCTEHWQPLPGTPKCCMLGAGTMLGRWNRKNEDKLFEMTNCAIPYLHQAQSLL